MENTTLKKLVLTAIFIAMAVVVGFIQIPWPPAPFLAIDFSEVIVLAALVVLGFKYVSITIVLRSLVRLLIGLTTTSGSALPYFGEVMAIVASFTIIFLYFIITKITKTSHKPLYDHKDELPTKNTFIRNLINVIFVSVMFSLLMTAFNYFFAFPINMTGGKSLFVISYVKEYFNNNYWTYTISLVPIVLPFNLAKIAASLLIFEPIHYRLRLMDIVVVSDKPLER